MKTEGRRSPEAQGAPQVEEKKRNALIEKLLEQKRFVHLYENNPDNLAALRAFTDRMPPTLFKGFLDSVNYLHSKQGKISALEIKVITEWFVQASKQGKPNVEELNNFIEEVGERFLTEFPRRFPQRSEVDDTITISTNNPAALIKDLNL